MKKILKNKHIYYNKEKELNNLIKHDNNFQARDKSIESNVRFLYHYLKKYLMNMKMNFQIYSKEGMIVLLLAVEKYDMQFGNKFLTYAVWWGTQTLDGYCHSISNTIRFPENRISKLNLSK